MNIKRTKCELCGFSDSSHFLGVRGIDFLRNRLFSLLKCKSCGLIYLDSKIIKEEVDSLYFREYHGNQAPFFSKYYQLIINLFMQMRARKIEKMNKKGTILDIGCGNGAFLKKMDKRKWICYGIDISPHAIDLAGGENGIKLICGDLQDTEFPDNFFDVVTFWQSFEHIEEPSKILAKVNSILKENGVFFISVPNIESLEARMNIKKWFGLELPRHIYHYSPETLTKMLEKNNFKVVSLSKNSAEYNIPFFVQSFFNVLGGEFNLLYNLFKRNQTYEKDRPFLRAYTIVLMLILLPIFILLSPWIYFINVLLNQGPVLEIFAKKTRY